MACNFGDFMILIFLVEMIISNIIRFCLLPFRYTVILYHGLLDIMLSTAAGI